MSGTAISFKTIFAVSVVVALSSPAPAQAGFDWIPSINTSALSQKAPAIDGASDGYAQLGARPNRAPEIYIKREKISPRDARAELERTDYDEINAMADALVFDEPVRSIEATPMVMQTHPQHGPVQIVPVRPNYGGTSSVTMNSPEITMSAMPPQTAVRPSAVNRVAPVAPPSPEAVASYDDYRQQNNFVQTEPPMLVPDEPLAPIMKAAPQRAQPQKQNKHAMVYIPDPQASVIDLPAPKGLSINPYPQAGLDIPATVIPAPAKRAINTPSSTTTLAGFGSDLPLVIALQQVIPPHYRYQFASSVNLGQTTSWSGGKSWDGVLMDMLAPLGLSARIDGQTVYIVQNASRV